MATISPKRLSAIRRKLRDDYVFYPERMLWIIDKQGERVQFKLKRPQLRMAHALMRQRESGEPQRAVILKARQVGFSTQTQGLLIQRASQIPNHLAMVVAQDRQTAAALFKIGQYQWANLPDEIQPEIAQQADTLDRKYMVFGEPSAALRRQGVMGLNSQVEIATAKEAVGGRGRTPRSLHVSELAFYDKTDKLLGLINGVPDDPDSLVVLESTARGHNHFKDTWDMAVAGESGYYPMFTPWFEEDGYRRRFANEPDMLEFESTLGRHPRYGEDEPALVELIQRSYRTWAREDRAEEPEEEWLRARVLGHLYWRRWAIATKTEGSVDKFHQEYPSTPEEAFLATGNRVFDSVYVSRVVERCERTDPVMPNAQHPGPAAGLFRATEWKARMDRTKQRILVPSAAAWIPASARERDEVPRWRLWAAPQKRMQREDGTQQPEGQYIIGCDPASGETDEKGLTHAEHAIQVVDHRTRAQVASWVSQIDPDLVALELLMAALHFNNAWVAVERTGGYGLSMLRKLALDYAYPYVFTEQPRDQRTGSWSDRLGFSTDAVSKPVIEGHGMELLRLEKDGIQERETAKQMLTYIRNDRGRSMPEPGKLSDRLMAWLIAQHVANIRPIKPDKGEKRNRRSTSTHKVRSQKAGW